MSEMLTASAFHPMSDGVATDLRRLCAESRVGATVTVGALPIAAGTLRVAAAVDQDVVAWATGGGEDYELLVVSAPDAFSRLAAGLERETGTTLTRIGTIERGNTVRFVDAQGREVDVARGFEHFVTRR